MSDSKFFWVVICPWSVGAILWDNGKPLLFNTRREAREYTSKNYGYIKNREDIRSAPHHWRLREPRMIKLTMELL